MTAALEVAVARRIGAFELDVAFTVESGMSVLFGPSGAGKSLTLALIAGLIRPDSGTVVINGDVVTDCARHIYVSPQRRRIGMVFQDGLLLPHRSVLDNVALAVRQAKGRSERRAVARSWLERVGADKFADRRPGSLSGWPASAEGGNWHAVSPLASRRSCCSMSHSPALDSAVRRELRELIREVITSSGVPACTRDPRCCRSRGAR